jgi:hypothetical protein
MLSTTHKKIPLSRKLIIWAGSYLLIAVCSIYYFGMPLFAAIGAGVMTLALTLIQHFSAKSQ